jgi:chromosome segregation ATPase
MALTIEERFKAAEAIVISLTAERDDLRKSVEAAAVNVSAELDSVKVELAAKESALADLAAKLEEANAKVAALEASAQSGAKEAANILASSGVEAVKATDTTAAAVASLAEQYAAMPAGAERRAFFKKHKAVLFSSK